MGDIRIFPLSDVEVAAWCVQAALILLSLNRRETTSWLPRVPITACLLVICIGWAWRLSYLFALSSGGFRYWIADDMIRWIYAYDWSSGVLIDKHPFWLPASYVLHGSFMRWTGEPLLASKLVSSIYNVSPLVAIFLFAQSLYRSSLFSCLCVVFATPWWLHILLGSGTMTEMPVLSLSLAAAGLILFAIREECEERSMRRKVLLGMAALGLAAASSFHLVAWIQLAGILPCLLLYWLRRPNTSWSSGFSSWLGFALVSSSYCLIRLLRIWITTGNPFSQLNQFAAGSLYKSGVPIDLAAQIVRGFDATSVVIYATTLMGLGGLLLTAWALRSKDPRTADLKRRLGQYSLLRIRRTLIGVTVAGLFASGWAWSAFGSPLRFVDFGSLTTNASLYPISLAFALSGFLPLAAYGVVHTTMQRGPDAPLLRAVLSTTGVVFGLFVLTALIGGGNVSPYRTVTPIAAALLPPALASVIPPAPTNRLQGVRLPIPRRFALHAALVMLLLSLNAWDSHQKILENRIAPITVRRNPRVAGPRADAVALGAWVRREALQPGWLSPENWKHPFYVWMPQTGKPFLLRILLEYAIGDPRWTSRVELAAPMPNAERAIAGLAHRQVMITVRAVDDRRLRQITRIGHFWIYEAVEPPR